ncbi:hypothetical protein LG3211_0786 [Lysobacter gummosus]|nr:hypothetical protein LG3211_0786 [Lysobacter gummosus]
MMIIILTSGASRKGGQMPWLNAKPHGRFGPMSLSRLA